MNIYSPGPMDGVVKAQGKRRALRQTAIAVAVTSLFFAPGIHETEAAFTTNFTGVGVTGGTYDKRLSTGSGNYYIDYSCDMSYTVVSNIGNFDGKNHCGDLTGSNSDDDWSSHRDQTPFFQAMFTDTSTNLKYFHVIIGDKNEKGTSRSEMVFEYIIQATTNQMDGGGLASASYTNDNSQTDVTWDQRRPFDATDVRQGNGSGNPTRAIMNQVLYNDDGTVNTQFLKGIQGGTVSFNKTTGLMTLTGGSIVFDSKPIITQFANDGGMLNQFTIDMRHKSYSDKTQMSDVEANGPNGKITNITNLVAGGGFANPAADQGDYDTTDATFTPHYVNNHNPNYTAGAYTYTATTSNGYYKLGSGGTYSYDITATTFVETGFQPWTSSGGLDWTDFCDPDINPDWITNTSGTPIGTIGGANACKNNLSTGKQGKKSRGW